METNLRPLTLGEVLDRTAQLYRTHFILLAGIASVYATALLAFSLAEIALQEILRARHMTSQLVWTMIVGAVVAAPFMIMVGGLAVAANNRAVSWVHLGEPASIGAAYRSIFPKLGRYLWLMILTALIVWVPLGSLYAAYLAFVLLYVRPRGILTQVAGPHDLQAYLVFGLVTLAFALLALAGLVYATLMGLRYSLAVPACVIEDIKATKALRRSAELSKGSRGRIFLLGLLVVAVQTGLTMITHIFFLVMAFREHGQLSAGIRVVQQLVAFCTNTFVGPIYATGFTLFYYDQRVRKEGFDLEWMMHVAGLHPQVVAPTVESTFLSAPTKDPLA